MPAESKTVEALGPGGVREAVSGASFSPCGRYRYTLFRRWRPGADRAATLVAIGLNPSTADAEKNDPTIRRIIGFAKRDGFGALVMLNLFAFRATDPYDLWEHRRKGGDIVGPGSDEAIREACVGVPRVLAAWGADPGVGTRAAELLRLLDPARLVCLGTTKSGAPRHPLYVKGDAPMRPWGRA